MKAILELEAIGDNCGCDIPHILVPLLGTMPKRYWVAEIVGFDIKYKYKRVFVKGNRDYLEANGAGTRGVFVNYVLESGHIYEVKSPETWTRTRKYFCTVTDDGDIFEIDQEAVDQWIHEECLE